MLTLNDGRTELWQWDTGRKLTVDADCSQVHFSNKVFGRSIDVNVVDGVAVIPDILLQTDRELTAWAFVGTAENGYTKIGKTFKVNRRNKPADYVFTSPEQTTLEEIKEKLDYLESIQDPDAIKNAVDEYLANNPIQIDEKDPTVPDWAKQTTKPKYTAQEVGAVATVNGTAPDENGNVEIEIPEASEPDMTGYATERYVQENYQPKGNYLTKVPEGYAKAEDIPAKPEDIGAQPAGNYLTEVPSGYATEEFVKNKIAEAELGGEEVDLSGYAQKSELPTKVSELENDAGYLTEHQDLSDYAKKTEIPAVPVQSVNGKTGDVALNAEDVGALPDTYTPPNQTAEQVGADPKGTAASAVSQHNASDDSHGDIRLELKAINDRLTAFFDSDNQTLDELSEIVDYITSNKSLIDSITTSKVSVADIVNNLTSNVSNKPLSAAQGVVLKGLIDTLSGNLANYQPKGDYALRSELPNVPTKLSAFTNDAGYLTEHQDISGKLDASALPTAINTALAQAKASGEFDGKDGVDGQPGKDGADGEDYILTEADKSEIATLVIEMLGGNPIFGIVDENNNIIVSGGLPDGTYSVKYEMENGSTVNIGNLVLDTNVYYTVTNTLTNCTNSNSATKAAQGGSYSATITAKSGYELKSVSATMGGTAVSVSNGKINIANVTGNIVITAVAEEVKAAEPVTENITITAKTSIVVDTGATRENTAGYAATDFIDVSAIPKPCVINLTGVKWTYTNTTDTGYIRFYITDVSGTKLASGYTHPSKMPDGVTMVMNNNSKDDVTVTVNSANIGKLRFVCHYTDSLDNFDTNIVKATLTYTPNS